MISPSKRRFLPPLVTKRDFNVYNEEYAKRTKDEVDSEDLKETIKKLNKEIRKKKNEIKTLKDRNERSQSLLYKDLSDIEKIFIKLNNVKANERIKAFVNECNDTNKEKALAYLLQKQKEELNKRLLQRDKEIDMIKASERGFKFLNMNDKMISEEQKKTNHIETELVKAQAQNKALDEILNEEQLTIKPLQDEFTSNEKSISYLQFTLSELKKKQTSLE